MKTKLVVMLILATLILSMPMVRSDIDFQETTTKLDILTFDEVSEMAEIIEDHVEIVSNGEEHKGLTLVNLRSYNATTGRRLVSYNPIFDSEGDLKYMPLEGASLYKMINSTTFLGVGENPEGNVSAIFWNMETNVTEYIVLSVSQHHDIDYNPNTDTFMILSRSEVGEYNGLPVWYDDVYEMNRAGDILFHWNGSEAIPLDTNDPSSDEIFRGHIDPQHGNSIFWDEDTDLIYLNLRHLDTFYAINHNTGDIDWSVGRLGSLKSIALNGSEVDTLFYHAHAVEKIGEDKFILYDNDKYNLTRGVLNDDGESRMVELEVDLDAGEARETWNWTPEGDDYYSPAWGDADRLPNGNRIGTFGNGINDFADGMYHPLHISEVNEEGEVVWEIKMNGSSAYDYSWEWGAYRAERIYTGPLVEYELSYDNETTGSLSIDFELWNSYRNAFDVDGVVTIKNGDDTLATKNFEFLKFWQGYSETVDLEGLAVGNHTLTVIVENDDGASTTETIEISIVDLNTEENPIGYFSVFVAFTIVITLKRQKKINF